MKLINPSLTSLVCVLSPTLFKSTTNLKLTVVIMCNYIGMNVTFLTSPVSLRIVHYLGAKEAFPRISIHNIVFLWNSGE